MAQEPKRLKLAVTAESNALKSRAMFEIARVAAMITDILYEHENVPPFPLDNITFGNQLGTAVYSIMNYQRKEVNTGIQSGFSGKSITIIYYVADVQKKFTMLVSEVLERIVRRGSLYLPETIEDRRKYFGTLMPLLELWCLFPLRWNESRLGQSVFFENSAQEKGRPVSMYGLGSEYSHLLEGITYQPERKSSLLQSLGALTLVISLIRQTNSQYKGKYKDALFKTISHIQGAEEIIEYFTINESRSSPEIIRELGNVLLLAGDRHSSRIAIPFIALINKYRANFFNDGLQEVKNDKGEVIFKTYLKTPYLLFDIPYDSTGKKAYSWIKEFQSKQWKICWNDTVNTVRQVVFHSMMGTLSSSFSVLKTITDNNVWNTRQQLGKAYKDKMNKVVTIEPIKLIYASKMSTAAKNSLLATGTGSITCSEPFSGHYIKEYKREEIDFVQAETSSRTGIGNNPQVILTNLRSIKRFLISKIEERFDSVECGTTEWQRLDDYIAGNNNTVSLELVSSGPNFLTTEKV